MASNNFLQWNAGKVNQDNDSEYVLETQRVGGAVSGLFPSKLANKLFYQCSIMAAAMGEMMKGKGFEMSDAVFADLITSLSHILTDAQFGSSAGTVCQGNDPRLDRELPTATKVWFWQNTAPTGWTIDATAAADAVLAVKAGSGTYAVAGGSQAGTWTQPSHTHTGGSHTHTVGTHTHSFTGVDHLHTTGNHTLTISEMPSHLHSGLQAWGGQGTGGIVGSTINVASGTAVWFADLNAARTGSVGGGKAHNHGNTGAADRSLAGTTGSGGAANTGASGTTDTGASATPNTWRPVANVGIICKRDA
jgi:hypothetical protein